MYYIARDLFWSQENGMHVAYQCIKACVALQQNVVLRCTSKPSLQSQPWVWHINVQSNLGVKGHMHIVLLVSFWYTNSRPAYSQRRFLRGRAQPTML